MMEYPSNRDASGLLRPGAGARWLMAVNRGRAVAVGMRSWRGGRVVHALGVAVLCGMEHGRIELVTEGEPVVAQVLEEESDVSVGEPFDLAGRMVLALPEGEYRLRVEGTGRLGRTFRFAVTRGQTQRYTVSIDEGRLLGGEESRRGRIRAGMRYAELTAARELTSGKADLIEWTEKSLICRDGKSGDVRWDASHAVKPKEGAFDAVGWLRTNTSWGEGGVQLVEQAPDMNGDGTGDLVWYSGHAAELLAVSGKDGSRLWRYYGKREGIGGNHVAGAGSDFSSTSRNAGAPAIVDLDQDGAPDVVATFLDYGSSNDWFIVSAISGRTGHRLWTHPSDTAMLDRSRMARDRPAVLVHGRRSTFIAFVHGTEWLGLDPQSGRVQAGPIELGFVPVRPVQHADLDGDGEPEVIALGPRPTGTQRTLRAFSIRNRHELWSQTVDGGYDQSERGVPLGDFPLAVDLDGDGRSEIVVSDSGAMPPLDGYRGVRLLDGLTGTTRWRRPLRPETSAKDGLANVLAAPDLDGDGTHDLVTVSLFDGRDPPAFPGNSRRPAHLCRCDVGKGRPLAVGVEQDPAGGDVRADLDAEVVGAWSGRVADARCRGGWQCRETAG